MGFVCRRISLAFFLSVWCAVFQMAQAISWAVASGACSRCGFQAKWGTDSNGSGALIPIEVGRDSGGKWGTLSVASERCPTFFGMVPHQFRNAAPFRSEWVAE